jgi:hypothetical protein
MIHSNSRTAFMALLEVVKPAFADRLELRLDVPTHSNR